MLIKLLRWAILVVSLAGCTAPAQNDLSGDWAGTLSFPGASLRLIFHITDSENGPTTIIESVDQQNTMIPAETVVDGDSITFTVERLNVEYVAKVTGDIIVGEFTQFGNTMPDFTLSRAE